MAGELDDLVLLPHCDLHVALTGTPPLTLRVFRRTEKPGVVEPYTLTEVRPADCTYAFMAPYRATGNRFDGIPTVDGNGVVHPDEIGVYLFQVGVGDRYLVGRLQVHQRLENWWFGNSTLTTALDPVIGHALPTIYARFSDDDNATDLIGDISGHGYVTLTSEDPQRVVITDRGWLRGLVETPQVPPGETPDFVNITGTLGTKPPRVLPVGVADYRKERRILADHQLWNLSELDDMQNVLILAEGFEGSDADRAVFSKAAETITSELFSRRRHEPYGTLKERFNVFSAFEESFERGITCGNRVTDTTLEPVLPSGTLIPYENPVEAIPPGVPLDRRPYAMSELVKRVGLPPRVDIRPDLVQVWKDQGLDDFNPARVNAKLLKAYRTHRSLGILQARDSFFGLMAGQRPADRTMGQGKPVRKPAKDAANDPDLKPFVKRVYEFYDTGSTGLLRFDPRRHPPELHAPGRVNPLNSLFTYAKALGYINPYSHVHRHIGQVWALETPGLRRSRGLIAVVLYDHVGRGVNSARSITLNPLRQATRLVFTYDVTSPVDPALMLRAIPAPDPDTIELGEVVDVVAHEFGHTFNLGDEYEANPADGRGDDAGDLVSDNLTRLGHVRLHPAPRREINMANVKWLDLPRMQHSSRLVRDSATSGSPPGITIAVDPDQLDVWRAVQKAGPGRNKVSLRQFKLLESGEQLPLGGVLLEGLEIAPIADGTGTLVLTGPNLPSTVFGTGSVLYVPLRDGAGTPLTVVDRRVMAFLRQNPNPLNSDPDHKIPRDRPDTPHPVPGLAPHELRRTLIGIFEGGRYYAGAHYRPAGACKMRNGGGTGDAGSFCFVCMWLIVNRVDPSHHAAISSRFYPGRRR
ncbi:hypothetical protein ACFTWH_07015 [Streptomyces sp. NPDC057011]|uniref:hypothetical protein n=1 Tax=unclassified Streptomyces TaxID=2593676 RepID=UPI0036377D6A